MVENFSFQLLHRITHIQKQLQLFLEQDLHMAHEHFFEISRDSTLFRGLSVGLPEDYVKKVIIIFSRLALFYNSGVLIENQDNKWTPQALFHQGNVNIIQNSPYFISIPYLPTAFILNAYKASAEKVLKALGLSHLDNERKSTLLIIKITPDYAYILLSHLPDLWLKDHIALTTTELQNCIMD